MRLPRNARGRKLLEHLPYEVRVHVNRVVGSTDEVRVSCPDAPLRFAQGSGTDECVHSYTICPAVASPSLATSRGANSSTLLILSLLST